MWVKWTLTFEPAPPTTLQLKTTTTHINNIFNVPQVVEMTYDLIKQGELLEAHRKYVFQSSLTLLEGREFMQLSCDLC